MLVWSWWLTRPVESAQKEQCANHNQGFREAWHDFARPLLIFQWSTENMPQAVSSPKRMEKHVVQKLNTAHSLEPSPAKLAEISWTQADPQIHGQERNACDFSDIEF